MRKLTILRRKNFPRCLVKLKVYIEDRHIRETSIKGVPCRLLGTIKNGNTSIFEIPTTSARLFIVAHKRSSFFYSEILTIPEGKSDVFLSGQVYFDPLLWDPFQFDRVTEDITLKNRRKNSKRTTSVTLTLVALFLALAALLRFFDLKNAMTPKVFSKKGVTITLTKDFSIDTEEQSYVVLENGTFTITISSEIRQSQITQISYAYRVRNILEKENNITITQEVTIENDFVYFECETDSVFFPYHYGVYVYTTTSRCYFVVFGATARTYEDSRDQIAKWVESIQVL